MIEDLTIASYPTTISFIYGHGIGIKSVITPETDPDGKVNVGKYVNLIDVTEHSWVTEDSWILLNISYNDADVTNLEEDSLRLYRWNETEWEEIPGSNVNTAKNYVYANVTNFSQIAPFGNPIPTPTPKHYVGGGGRRVTPTPSPTPTPVVSPTPTPTVTPTATPTVTPATPTPRPTPTPTPKPGIPGFKAVLAIAGLLAVAYLALRRKQ